MDQAPPRDRSRVPGAARRELAWTCHETIQEARACTTCSSSMSNDRDAVRAALEARGRAHRDSLSRADPPPGGLRIARLWPGSLPRTERACDRVLSMPLYPEMTPRAGGVRRVDAGGGGGLSLRGAPEPLRECSGRDADRALRTRRALSSYGRLSECCRRRRSLAEGRATAVRVALPLERIRLRPPRLPPSRQLPDFSPVRAAPGDRADARGGSGSCRASRRAARAPSRHPRSARPA